MDAASNAEMVPSPSVFFVTEPKVFFMIQPKCANWKNPEPIVMIAPVPRSRTIRGVPQTNPFMASIMSMKPIISPPMK